MKIRPRAFIAVAFATIAAASVGWLTLASGDDAGHRALADDGPATVTPIKHVIVIFGENESYDHYFGTYPAAANNDASEPTFTPLAAAPTNNNYLAHPDLLTANPNANNPARFKRSQAFGCGNNHNYDAEQRSFNGGLMNKFVENTGGGCGGNTMNYFDGNTVTGLWNLAQAFTMSDNFYDTTFGPSTPGAINLISGNTHGANKNDADATGTLTGDPDPVDDCGSGANTVMSGKNIGDLLNTKGVTWGWFQGGFKPTASPGGVAQCGTSHTNIGGGTPADYSPHHEPFQYYASTGNPHHLPPTAAIGQSDQANHQYDLSDFDSAISQGKLPQVSFLKAGSYEDAHPGNSDPLDEQQFISRVIDEVSLSQEWDSTAIFLAYDDSDGWYDHAYAGDAAINPSAGASDGLNGVGVCGKTAPAPGAYLDRCGPGPRLPFLIVSPWVSPNTIHHTLREQTSITKFIEDNWNLGQIGDQSFDARAATLDSMFDFDTTHTRAGRVVLDPTTGQFSATVPANSCAVGSSCPAFTVATATPPPVRTPVPGTSVTPVPTATAGATTVASPTPTVGSTASPTPTPTTGPVKSFKPKVSCSAKLKGGKVKVACSETGVTTTGKIKLNLTLKKGKTTVATGSGTVKSGAAAIKVKAKKHARLAKGRYTLKLVVKQGSQSKSFSKTLKIK